MQQPRTVLSELLLTQASEGCLEDQRPRPRGLASSSTATKPTGTSATAGHRPFSFPRWSGYPARRTQMPRPLQQSQERDRPSARPAQPIRTSALPRPHRWAARARTREAEAEAAKKAQREAAVAGTGPSPPLAPYAAPLGRPATSATTSSMPPATLRRVRSLPDSREPRPASPWPPRERLPENSPILPAKSLVGALRPNPQQHPRVPERFGQPLV